MDDAFRARRLAWSFTTKGGNGRLLMAITEFDEATRAELVRLANVKPPEEPAFGLLRSAEDWFLVTSRRVTWKQGGIHEDVIFSNLEEAFVDFADVRATSKTHVDVLTLVMRNGVRRRLKLESGGPVFGAWNALRSAARMGAPSG